MSGRRKSRAALGRGGRFDGIAEGLERLAPRLRVEGMPRAVSRKAGELVKASAAVLRALPKNGWTRDEDGSEVYWSQPDPDGFIRCRVQIPAKLARQVRQLARERGVPTHQVLTDALALFHAKRAAEKVRAGLVNG